MRFGPRVRARLAWWNRRGLVQAAAKRYLENPLGLTTSGDTLSVSSILKWYGEDFVERYESRGPGSGARVGRAIRGLIAALGPAEAASVAASGRARIRFLSYDWSLNDVTDGR